MYHSNEATSLWLSQATSFKWYMMLGQALEKGINPMQTLTPLFKLSYNAQKVGDHSALPFSWAATKFRITSRANWWAFLFWCLASSSMASYVSLSAKSFRLNCDVAFTGPSHFSTISCSFSMPCNNVGASELELAFYAESAMEKFPDNLHDVPHSLLF